MALKLGPVHRFATATSTVNNKQPARLRPRSRPQQSQQSSPSSDEEAGTGPENKVNNVDELDPEEENELDPEEEENGVGDGSDEEQKEEVRTRRKVSGIGKKLSVSLTDYGSGSNSG